MMTFPLRHLLHRLIIITNSWPSDNPCAKCVADESNIPRVEVSHLRNIVRNSGGSQQKTYVVMCVKNVTNFALAQLLIGRLAYARSYVLTKLFCLVRTRTFLRDFTRFTFEPSYTSIKRKKKRKAKKIINKTLQSLVCLVHVVLYALPRYVGYSSGRVLPLSCRWGRPVSILTFSFSLPFLAHGQRVVLQNYIDDVVGCRSNIHEHELR